MRIAISKRGVEGRLSWEARRGRHRRQWDERFQKAQCMWVGTSNGAERRSNAGIGSTSLSRCRAL